MVFRPTDPRIDHRWFVIQTDVRTNRMIVVLDKLPEQTFVMPFIEWDYVIKKLAP